MPGGYGIESLGFANRFKPAVAKFPGSHLDRKSVFSSVFPGIKVLHKYWRVPIFCQFADKCLVCVGLFAAQMKITMHNAERLLSLPEQMGASTISLPSAAYSRQYTVCLGNRLWVSA